MSQTFYQTVAIIGPVDPRAAGANAYKTGRISKAEFDQMQTSMGLIYCAKNESHSQTFATGVIALRDDLLITVGHMFVDEEGHEVPASDCFFIDAKNPQKKHFLVAGKGSSLSPYRDGIYALYKDYAILHLRPPVTEATPFQVDRSDRPTAEREKVTVVNNFFDVDRKHYKRTTNVQQCYDRGRDDDDQSGVGIFYNDCTSFPGDSGSPYFIRSTSGQLLLKGLQLGQVRSTHDYCQYDGPHCRGTTIELRGAFLADVLNQAP